MDPQLAKYFLQILPSNLFVISSGPANLLEFIAVFFGFPVQSPLQLP